MMMKILFLHGWHSVPGGVKPSYLMSTATRSSTRPSTTRTSTGRCAPPRPSTTGTAPT